MFDDDNDLAIIRLTPTTAITCVGSCSAGSILPNSSLPTQNYPSGVTYTPIELAAVSSLASTDQVFAAGYGQCSATKSSQCSPFGGQYGELFQTSGVVQSFLNAKSKEIITNTNSGSSVPNGATAFMISSSGDHSSTICSGDSGGPLFKRSSPSSPLQLVGVADIAFTDQYGNCVTNSNFLHVNATNSAIQTWINANN